MQKQLATVEEAMAVLDTNFTQEEIVSMKTEEARWLVEVLNLDSHATLKNPYEIKSESGMFNVS